MPTSFDSPTRNPCYAFLPEASSLFPNTNTAVEHLLKLKGPPKSIDISNLGSKVETALQIIGVLASDVSEAERPGTSHLASIYIKAKWNILGPWIKFLLEHIALSEDIPLTPKGVDARARTLSLIPIALMFPDRHDSKTLAFIKRTSPYFHPLIAQVWWRSIEMYHPSWGLRSRVLVDVGFCEVDPDKPISAFTGSGPYQPSTELGLIFIQHLNLEARRIPMMTAEDLDKLEDFLTSLSSATFGNTQRPTHYPTVRRYTVSALIKIIYSLSTKRKSLRKSFIENEECQCAHGVVVVASGLVRYLMNDYFYASLALRGGILEALFRAPHCIFSFNDHGLEIKNISSWAVKILGQVSRFLVNPSVLHHFLKIVRRIERCEGLEGELQSKSQKDLWRNWKKKATSLQELRSKLQKDISFMCSADQCPLRRLKPFEQISNLIHWGRCSVCETVLYCSRTCQRADWKQRHKSVCDQLNKDQIAGSPTPTRIDYRFFHEWTRYYLSIHPGFITNSVLGYVTSLSLSGRRLSEDQQSIKNQKKYPIVFLEFDKTGFLYPQDCVEILDTTSLPVKIQQSLAIVINLALTQK